MPYTLWSRGRLLGESELDFVRVSANHRMGWFQPTPFGETMMPVLTGPSAALRAVGELLRDPVRRVTRPPQNETPGTYPSDIRATTEYADLVSSVDELESMELQVRDAEGRVVDVEHVGIDDVEIKKSFLPRKLRQRIERAMALEQWEPSTQPQARYHMQVHLRDTGEAEVLENSDVI